MKVDGRKNTKPTLFVLSPFTEHPFIHSVWNMQDCLIAAASQEQPWKRFDTVLTRAAVFKGRSVYHGHSVDLVGPASLLGSGVVVCYATV